MTKKERPYGSTDEEVKMLLVQSGKVIFNASTIEFKNYPFEPSSVYKHGIIDAADIKSIDIQFAPQILVGDELIFIAKNSQQRLISFAKDNNIPIKPQPSIWSWILEPFLDTEFTEEKSKGVNMQLFEYGFTKTAIDEIRNEVKEQMLKYNFDTGLWDWIDLNLYDVLSAMRIKYDKEKFTEFYHRAMKIALLPKLT